MIRKRSPTINLTLYGSVRPAIVFWISVKIITPPTTAKKAPTTKMIPFKIIRLPQLFTPYLSPPSGESRTREIIFCFSSSFPLPSPAGESLAQRNDVNMVQPRDGDHETRADHLHWCAQPKHNPALIITKVFQKHKKPSFSCWIQKFPSL